MIDVSRPKFEPTELQESGNASLNAAEKEDAAIEELVMYPPSEATFGFRGVHTGYNRVFPAGAYSNRFRDNTKGPSDAACLYHFVGLAGVSREKSGSSKQATAAEAPRSGRSSIVLFCKLRLNIRFPLR